LCTGKSSAFNGVTIFEPIADELASSGAWGPTNGGEELPGIGESGYPGAYWLGPGS